MVFDQFPLDFKTRFTDYSIFVFLFHSFELLCFVSHAVYLVDPHLVFSAGKCCTFDILHENELVDGKNAVAVISRLLPITLGQNASH